MTGFVKASGRDMYHRENRFLRTWGGGRTTTNTIEDDGFVDVEGAGLIPMEKPWIFDFITRPVSRAKLLSSVAPAWVRIPGPSDYVVTWRGEGGRLHVQKGI